MKTKEPVVAARVMAALLLFSRSVPAMAAPPASDPLDGVLIRVMPAATAENLNFTVTVKVQDGAGDIHTLRFASGKILKGDPQRGPYTYVTMDPLPNEKLKAIGPAAIDGPDKDKVAVEFKYVNTPGTRLMVGEFRVTRKPMREERRQPEPSVESSDSDCGSVLVETPDALIIDMDQYYADDTCLDGSCEILSCGNGEY